MTAVGASSPVVPAPARPVEPDSTGRDAAPHPRTAGDGERPRRYATSFRSDIEGLRAVAVLAVLGYHAALPVMPGGYVGVDVFFVISGFLITGLLLAEIERDGRFSLTRFYARRARRILPAAGVVLAATSVASAFLLAPLRRQDVAYDVIAAGLNVGNWRFIAQQTDYLAAGRAESPLLHFWSLAVEEQFYLVWAPLALILVLLAGWLRRPPVRVLAICVGLITVASFVVSLRLTSTNAPLAYLGSPSRAWQFGVGALGALVAPAFSRALREARRGAATAIALGFAGTAAVVWAIVGFDTGTPYPGIAAVAPTIGTVAILLAGGVTAAAGGRPVGIGRALATRPMGFIGRLSYSWYLWHWPVLIFWQAAVGPPSWPTGLALVSVAAVPAWLTMHLVEAPIRLSPRVTARAWRGLSAGLVAVTVAVASGAFLGVDAARALDAAAAPGPYAAPPAPAGDRVPAVDEGHLYLPPYPVIPPGPPRPLPKDARDDLPQIGTCQSWPGYAANDPCLFGDIASPDRVILFGDSHAMQWYPALAEVAAARGWAVEVLGKSGCPVSTMVTEGRSAEQTNADCAQWRENTINRIAQEPTPKMIFVGTLLEPAYAGQAYLDAWDASLSRLRATGAPVVYLRDTPYPGKDIPDCVSGIRPGSGACDFPRATSLYPDAMAEVIGAGRRPGVYLFDATTALCPHETCPAVIDGILAYHDSSHITATASRALAPRLDRRLVQLGLA